ncbi:MAG TPA: VanZ family protein [Thermomicrobiales bacterium]|nr:VanZ family protein [Thermomicrobiales bacterium]
MLRLAAQIALYAVLAVVVHVGITHGTVITPRHVLLAIAASTLFGIAAERRQITMKGRTANPVDVLADFAGVSMACLVTFVAARCARSIRAGRVA